MPIDPRFQDRKVIIHSIVGKDFFMNDKDRRGAKYFEKRSTKHLEYDELPKFRRATKTQILERQARNN